MIELNLKDELLGKIREFVKINKLLTPSVVALTGIEANEYKALVLFAENMRLASEGLQFTLQPPMNSRSYYMYTAAILLYRQMIKQGSGIKRNKIKINLIDGAVRNKNGTIKINNGVKAKITPDRFYIEEFFKYSEEEFNTHHEMMDQADKYLCHIDKESDKKALAILVLENNKPFHLLNHFEYSMFNVNKIQTMHHHCINLMNITNNKLSIVAQELWTAAASSHLEDHKENQIFSSKDF